MQTTLYFNQGASDKIYTAHIIDSDDGFLVNFAYGRRGNSLKSGSKTKQPVSREKAEAIFNKLVKSKVAKGYTPDENGEVYSAVDSEQSGIHCQLLNPVDEATMIRLCHDDRYLAQEKHDGIRQLIEKTPDAICAINRKGLYTGLSKTVSDAVQQIDYNSIILDGEGLGGDANAVFDILHLNGNDLTMLPYLERLSILESLSLNKVTELVKTAFTTDEKLALVLEVKKRNGEGVVFKDVSATYEAGRPASGGSQLKFKFYESASVLVSHQNEDRRSVKMSVLNDEGVYVCVGNVTIPPNYDVPDVGDVIEVRHLYFFGEGGSLYQPQYLGKRTDIDKGECKMSKLKLKPNTQGVPQ